MRRIKLIEQMEHSECGLACAAMIINYLGGKINLNQLRDEYGVPNGGYNLLQLSEILNAYKVKTKGIRIHDISGLEKKFFPCIAFWKGTHFVIIEKVSNKITIIDPTSGRRKISVTEFLDNFSGVALILLDSRLKIAQKKEKHHTFLRDLINYNKRLLLSLLFVTIILQLITLIIPYMIQRITDSIHYESLQGQGSYIFSLFIIVFGYYLTNIIRAILITKLQVNMDDMLLTKILTHLLKVPIRFFDNRSKGEIIFRINSNSYIRQIISEKIITVCIDVIFFFLYLFAMIRLNLELSLIIMLLGLVICTLSLVYTKKLNSIEQNQIIYSVKTQNMVTEIVENIATIKAFGVEDSVKAKWKEAFNKQMKYEGIKAKYNALLGNLPTTIQVAFPAFVYIVGSSYVQSEAITIGELIAFNTLAGFFLTPIMSLVGSYSDISIVKIYIRKLLDIIDSNVEDNGNTPLQIRSGELSLRDVHFQYNKFSPFVLKDININIESGSKVAIVGNSGSGKSTLLKIMASLYQPTSGSLYIDDVDTRCLNRRTIRQQLGIVLQEAELFNETIKNNILFYRKQDINNLNEILNALKINDMLKGSPIGIETIVSEGGTNFSGGQRQRISTARALYNGPKILLLDEPTSSLDSGAVRDFMDIIFQSDVTCVMISHRYHDMEKFDLIYVLEEGQIVAQGSHEQLLNMSNTYKKLYLNKEEFETLSSELST
ncbi:peptidase domain-containing ABC transporter [Amphibacillus sediminis]|uniref:peptidase domain-containing ABC transporter n=1 Tax=Amphibacillus sediminis TaxID=360185 RepID=UPI000830FD45|nr:peptidase domain-containing ABC transporter [Amphibacillus sediminis]